MTKTYDNIIGMYAKSGEKKKKIIAVDLKFEIEMYFTNENNRSK